MDDNGRGPLKYRVMSGDRNEPVGRGGPGPLAAFAREDWADGFCRRLREEYADRFRRRERPGPA